MLPAARDVRALDTETIHVYVVDLRRWSPADVADCEAVLSGDERERAARFLVAPARSRFTVCRAVLRRVLGALSGRDPQRLHLVYGPHGKPSLDPAQPTHQSPAFNVSHSGDFGIIAVGLDLELGIDVEHIRHFDDMMNVARRFFSSAEVDALSAVPADRFDRAFFRCWTRKEAFIKGLGEGISRPLDGFAVDFSSDDDIGPVRIDGAAADSEWRLLPVPVAAGYVAAAAANATRRITTLAP